MNNYLLAFTDLLLILSLGVMWVIINRANRLNGELYFKLSLPDDVDKLKRLKRVIDSKIKALKHLQKYGDKK